MASRLSSTWTNSRSSSLSRRTSTSTMLDSFSLITLLWIRANHMSDPNWYWCWEDGSHQGGLGVQDHPECIERCGWWQGSLAMGEFAFYLLSHLLILHRMVTRLLGLLFLSLKIVSWSTWLLSVVVNWRLARSLTLAISSSVQPSVFVWLRWRLIFQGRCRSTIPFLRVSVSIPNLHHHLRGLF